MQVQVTRTSGHQSTVEYKSLAQEVQELLCPDKPRIVYEGIVYDLIESSHSTPCQVDTHHVTLDSQATGATQMTATATTRTISHPQLQYLATANFGVLPSDLSFLDVPESEIAKMSHDELEDAVFFLDEGGYDHTTAWNKLYAQYRNDAYLASRGVMRNQPTITPEEKQMPTTVATVEATVEPEIAAAQDVRTLDIIENLLLNQSYNATMTDDIVLTIQEYMKAPNSTTQAALALLADSGKLRGVFKLVKQIQNSPEFQALVAENTPDELPKPTPAPKQTIVATDTTAEAIANESKPTKPSKAPKAKQKLPMPSITSIEALESMSRKELQAAIKAMNDNVDRKITATGKSSNAFIKEILAHHFFGLTFYKSPEKQKPAKAPKTPKAKKQEPVIALPEGLSWDEVKGMKYRALQQLGKAFRSQGHAMPRLNSKGDDIKAAIADAMRSMGHDIQEVSLTPANTKELHLPNLAQVRESQRLDRVASEALRMDAQGDTMGAWVHTQANVVAA